MDTYGNLQSAIFSRLTDGKTWYVLSQEHDVSITKLRRAYQNWLSDSPESQPLSPRDIHFRVRSPGRPLLIPPPHDRVILDSIKYFADHNTPLTRPGVRELIRTYVSMLGTREREKIDLGEHGPSDTCINSLMERNGLKYMSVQIVEDVRLQAITPQVVSEHIARVQSAIDRYRIHDPKFIFNTDQSGSSFRRMCGRSLRKGFGKKDKKLQQACVRTKGQLERVTIMPCVSASGKAYKPLIIFPGVQPHYRKVKGMTQDLYSVLPECYLYYRELPGADSAIVYDWAQKFLEETVSLRKNGQYLLLILDGYSAHIQFSTLNLFRRNRVIVIALPSHTSHRLQPLDVSVFSSYKSFLQGFLHCAARVKRVLNAFHIASVINYAYGQSMTGTNIRSGFNRCGIWDPLIMGTNIEHLQYLFDDDSDGNSTVTCEDLVNAFLKKGRSLLRDVGVESEGTIKIDTSKGANLTSGAVLEALKKRETKKKEAARKARAKNNKADEDVKEPRSALLHYEEISNRRHRQRKRLRESRESRRIRQKTLFASRKRC